LLPSQYTSKSSLDDAINFAKQLNIEILDIPIENIANIKLKREYQLDKPKGVNGRSSNNDLIKKVLNWNYNYSLNDGIEKTYHWINQLYQNKNNNNFIKFTKK
jgi:nucleoside-diphosphate-sugar epimerase